MAHPLHNAAIYHGIERMKLPVDVQGWGTEEHVRVFKKLIEETKPTTIIEVGSWKGSSAIRFAELTSHLSTHIFCCDTFLGSLEHMIRTEERGRDYDFRTLHGFPLLYFTFLTNIAAACYTDRITPIPNTSFCCANYLASKGVKADLIYIDGDHTTNGCYQDICAYQHLLASPTSVLVGDDWDIFPTVNKAVNLFHRENKHRFLLEIAKPLWILRQK